MKIAIPVQAGRLNGHFGGSTHFALVEADPVTNSITALQTLEAPEHKPGVYPKWLRSLGVEVVIAGGIGHRALAIFAETGIKVVAGTQDATVEELVRNYLSGKLTLAPDGCDHHDHGDHGHGHHHH